MSSPAFAPFRVRTNAAKSLREIKPFVWLFVIGIGAATPALLWGVPINRNLYNHYRFALPFYDAIRSGHWYPGWLAESNGGYGDPSFRFYPPGVYYLLALARTLTASWYAGTLVSITVIFLTGALGIYLWVREFTSQGEAAVAALVYTVAPYHLVQIYQAFLLAEFAGASVLPFAFAFLTRVCKRGRVRDIVGLAVSYAALVYTHLPLAVIGSIALLAYGLLQLPATRKLKTVTMLGVAVVLGLAASAPYWTTMVVELPWIKADQIPDPSVDYRNNFILSSLSSDNLNVWWMNILLLSTLALFWPGFAVFIRSIKVNTSGLRSAGLLMLLTAFMSTFLSKPIWALSHTLQATQFPWRWLSLTSMFGALIVAGSISFWMALRRTSRRPWLLLALGTMLASFAFSISHTIREAGFLDRTSFNQTLAEIPGSQGIPYWWPKWSTTPPRKMNQAVEAANRSLAIDNWASESRTFRIAAGPATEARVRTFYYPLWKATANGRDLATRADTDGALLISIPPDAVSVSLQFEEPARVRLTKLAAVISWIVLILAALIGPYRKSGSRPFESPVQTEA